MYILLFVFSNSKCAAELDGWNLEFDQNLVSYSARVLPTEVIMQAGGSKVSKRVGEGGREVEVMARWVREGG
jgi:hypothetical protein